MARKVWTEASIDFECIADGLVVYGSMSDAMALVLMIDERMSDLQWTKDLRDALDKIIAIEEKDDGS
ncbi:MAG TPA: hypothetical protein VIY48_13430 [Candidatus Paceibacterota bacterium]